MAAAQPPLWIRYDSTLVELFGFSEQRPLESATSLLTEPAPPTPALQTMPSLRDLHRPDDRPGDTTALVTRLWEVTETAPLIDDWEPDTFNTLATSTRMFRWPIIVAAVALLLGGLGLIQAASVIPDRAAADTTNAYHASIADYSSAVPGARATIAVVTDPTSDTASLSDAAVSLSSFDDSARDTFEVAAEPMPSVPFFVSTAPLDALTPIRQSMTNAADAGLTLENRIGAVLSYRLLTARSFQLPSLPTSATQDDIAALGVDLGLALTTTNAALSDLPDELFLADHKTGALQLAQRFEDWQVEYFEALRSGDTTQAEDLIRELTQRIDALNLQLDSSLAAIGTWANTQLDSLQTQLARIDTSF